METNETNKYFLPVAVILAGFLIAGAVMWNGSHPAGPGVAAEPGAAPKVNVKDVKTEGNPFIGRADAPATMIVWDDFQCPFCKKFKLETLSQIVKEYVDTGKLKIVFMDFAFQGEDSITAAVYGSSIWKLYPEQFYAWNMAMFTAQDEGGNQGFGDASSIDKLNATIPGIDVAKVTADVKANMSTYQAAIEADKDEAQKVGVNATPSFIVGTQMIQGAYPYPTFKAAIEDALK